MGRKFDHITIKLLPDIEHSLVAPKIAIEQFQIYFPVMRKYFSAFAFVFMLSIVVAIHHEKHPEDSAPDSTNQCLAISANNTPGAKQNSTQPYGDFERWWKLGFLYFGWPNGTTIWALFFTCIVIAEQTMEARKAAKATETQAAVSRQALIAQFRPKMIIRRIQIDPTAILYFDRRGEDAEWKIEMHIHNAGGTVAHIQKYSTFFQLCDGHANRPRDTVGELNSEEPFDIPAGGNKIIECILEDDKFRKMLIAIAVDKELEEEARRGSCG